MPTQLLFCDTLYTATVASMQVNQQLPEKDLPRDLNIASLTLEVRP